LCDEPRMGGQNEQQGAGQKSHEAPRLEVRGGPLEALAALGRRDGAGRGSGGARPGTLPAGLTEWRQDKRPYFYQATRRSARKNCP
jgi:hypothetical protein